LTCNKVNLLTHFFHLCYRLNFFTKKPHKNIFLLLLSLDLVLQNTKKTLKFWLQNKWLYIYIFFIFFHNQLNYKLCNLKNSWKCIKYLKNVVCFVYFWKSCNGHKFFLYMNLYPFMMFRSLNMHVIVIIVQTTIQFLSCCLVLSFL